MNRTAIVKKIIFIFGCIIFVLINSRGYYTEVLNAATDVDENVITFLNNLEDAANKMDTYRFVSESENWKGNEYEKKITMFQFKKPNLMRTGVLEGSKKGSVVVLNKEGKIIGKNSMGFKKTLKLTDKRLKNIRGYTFINSSLLDKIGRIKEHILNKGCKAALTEEEYMGKAAYRLHIDHKDPDDLITSEDVWFDRGTYVILKNLKYENEQKVTDTTWRDFEINIPLDDSLFEQ